MKRTNRLSTLVLCGVCMTMFITTGCSKSTTPAGNSSSPNLTSEFPLPDVAIPTQAEADAMAAKEITAKNADAEFEALMREVESDTGE